MIEAIRRLVELGLKAKSKSPNADQQKTPAFPGAPL